MEPFTATDAADLPEAVRQQVGTHIDMTMSESLRPNHTPTDIQNHPKYLKIVNVANK
jgi:hypothetical protein